MYLMRHGQAEHNVDQDLTSKPSCRRTHVYFMKLIRYLELDDAMTPLGRRQVQAFPSRTSDLQNNIDLIVTSPLKRAIYTTLLGWKPAIDRLGLANLVILPEAQECSDFPCDTGSDKQVLEQEPDFRGLNLSRLMPDWTSKKGFWAPDDASLANRARFLRHFLRDRPEKDIVLVCHGDFLRQLTGDASGPSRTYWKNAEMRIYKFDPTTVDGEECFFQLEQAPEATRGYDPRSSEADIEDMLNGKI